MSSYCKAYKLKDLRKYPHWTEKAENARKEKNNDGTESEKPQKLTDESILYLHDNYIVTDGIFDDKNIIFDDVTDEWKEFCTKELNFQIPEFVTQSQEKNEK